VIRERATSELPLNNVKALAVRPDTIRVGRIVLITGHGSRITDHVSAAAWP
jgi:hypothetical protein